MAAQFSLKPINKSIIRLMLWFLGYDNTISEETDNQPTTGNQSNSEFQEVIGSSSDDDETIFNLKMLLQKVNYTAYFHC